MLDVVSRKFKTLEKQNNTVTFLVVRSFGHRVTLKCAYGLVKP